VDDTIGNVHSGALPPWLDTTTDDNVTVQSSRVIGPTADDLLKHGVSLLFHNILSLSGSIPGAHKQN